jgi:hypothetical protein
MTDYLNYNIDQYTDKELLDIAELEENATKEEIDERFTSLIKSRLKEKDYDLAQFLHEAKDRLLDDQTLIDKQVDNSDDDEDQAESWFKNQYRESVTNEQQNKVTDRSNAISVFKDSTVPVMSRKRLGINNSFFSKYSQDSLNPTLRQLITTNLCIRSADRSLLIPFSSKNLPYNNPFKINESPSYFSVPFNQTLKNVLSIKIDTVSLPNSIYAFDKFYSSNYFYVYTSLSDKFTESHITSCSKITINSGTYNSIIDLVAQINQDLSNCLSPTLFDTTGKLYLTANAVDILTNNPKIIFINTSDTHNVKLLFYNKYLKEAETFRNGLKTNIDCSFCDINDNFEPYFNSASYNNNFGYNLGYRIQYDEWEIQKNNAQDAIINNSTTPPSFIDPSGSQYLFNGSEFNYSVWRNEQLSINLDFELSTILYKPLSSSASLTTELDHILNNLLYWDISYNKYLYNNDINQILQEFKNNLIDLSGCYSIASVPVNLHTVSDIYICVNDFKSNRSPDAVVTSNYTITDVLGIITLDMNNMALLNNVKSSKRMYFGPVKLERLEIKLVDQRGNIINLNGKDWVLNLSCEELYQY